MRERFAGKRNFGFYFVVTENLQEEKFKLSSAKVRKSSLYTKSLIIQISKNIVIIGLALG
jgi:hypothetical protein